MRVIAGPRALLLASVGLAVACLSTIAAAADADGSATVEHVTTSPDTGGTRHRARAAQPAPAAPIAASAPMPAAPAATPAAPASPKPSSTPARAKPAAGPMRAEASRPGAKDSRAARSRQGATVRKRPALDGQVLARLSAGTSVEIETQLQNDEDAWWYVSTPTVSGWIAAKELDLN
jgi:hypothetical protein